MAMDLDRRGFLKVLSAGALTATNLKHLKAESKAAAERSPNAVGILYDATVCIGCKVCETRCKEYNNLPTATSYLNDHRKVGKIWDAPVDLGTKTYNKIKVYKTGKGTQKNSTTDGFSFIKRHCMHCVDPDCVSVCPVTALQKDPVTGIVKYDASRCCGCRYCQMACPYLIPKFEYENALGQIQKCQMCDHIQVQGGIPGCCKACPTGASIFGKVDDLLDEAHNRLQLEPGTEYEFPVSTVDSREKVTHQTYDYVDYVYGETEGGGAQYLLLSAVPFENLGLPKLPDYAQNDKSEYLQHTLYRGLAMPATLLVGLMYFTYRNRKSQHGTREGEDDE